MLGAILVESVWAVCACNSFDASRVPLPLLDQFCVESVQFLQRSLSDYSVLSFQPVQLISSSELVVAKYSECPATVVMFSGCYSGISCLEFYPFE